MASANLVPRSPTAKGKGIGSCMHFFYDNDNKKINIHFICHIAELTELKGYKLTINK